MVTCPDTFEISAVFTTVPDFPRSNAKRNTANDRQNCRGYRTLHAYHRQNVTAWRCIIASVSMNLITGRLLYRVATKSPKRVPPTRSLIGDGVPWMAALSSSKFHVRTVCFYALQNQKLLPAVYSRTDKNKKKHKKKKSLNLKFTYEGTSSKLNKYSMFELAIIRFKGFITPYVDLNVIVCDPALVLKTRSENVFFRTRHGDSS